MAATEVSIVIPVYNPGDAIEPTIASLLAQTLSSDRFEVIFVDDGSTDATPGRLDALAVEHRNIRVFHEPASGWSGRPRNVGMDHAVGRYVFFCDHDDWLAPEALERMIAYADETAADVLIPKMVGHHREVPRQLFAANQPNATLENSMLMSSLSPHKLFRRGFLEAHKLRFPEGRRRLEDHVFVVAAYFLATTIAVLADYPCYHHTRREDEGNAAYDQTDPVEYCGYVREVIDVIEAHSEPGPLRDIALGRPFGNELLGRLTRPRVFGLLEPDAQQHTFDAVRAVIVERFPPSFGERSPITRRALAAAVRDNSIDTVRELYRGTSALRASGVLESMTWDRDRWRARIAAGVMFEDGSSVRLIPDGSDGWGIDERLVPPDRGGRRTVTAAELAQTAVLVIVRNRGTDEEWFAPAEFAAATRELEGDPESASRVVFEGTVEFDVTTIAGGSALADGLWDVSVRFGFLGITLRARVGVGAGTTPPLPSAAIIGPRPATVTPFLTDGQNKLSIDVGQRKRTLLNAIASGPIGPVLVADGQLRIPVAVVVAPGSAPRTLRLALVDGGTTVGRCDAVLEAAPHGAVLVASSRVVATGELTGPRSYDLATRSRAKDPLQVLGVATVDAVGTIVAVDL
jgi:hypothetical protein